MVSVKFFKLNVLLMGKENLLSFAESLCVVTGAKNALLDRKVCYRIVSLRHNGVSLCRVWEKEHVLVFISCACLAAVEACNKIILILFHTNRTFKIMKLGCTTYKHAGSDLVMRRVLYQHIPLLLVTVVPKSRFSSAAPAKHDCSLFQTHVQTVHVSKSICLNGTKRYREAE